jgi:hypothetical protein
LCCAGSFDVPSRSARKRTTHLCGWSLRYPCSGCFGKRASRCSSAQAFGPEFIARAVEGWLEASGVKTLYIEPGSAWENAYAEFNSRLEDELWGEVFAHLLEAKALLEEYRQYYNHERLHSALGYRTPAEFGALYELKSVDKELTKELESVSALSWGLVQKTGSGHSHRGN